jgi:ergothioneine biosynthesis protein EgtB
LLDTFGARGLADSDLKVALNMVLEHYMMHIETFVYMWHELNHSFKRNCFSSFEWHQQKLVDGQRRSIHQDQIDIPAGIATLGAARKEIDFGWCNEFGNTSQLVEQFQIDRFPVTNAEFAEFVDAGGYKQEQWWSKEAWAWLNARGHSHPHHWMRENQKWYYHGAAAVESLMENAPAWVSMCEASAFAHWRGGKLPTEAQFHRAAYANPSGEGESLYPWGESEPSASNGNFDLQYPAPTPIGQFPDGSSQFGVEELVGNGWEWTRTIFSPFPGFKPYPSYSGYSQDFFDDKHYVLKGGSPVTAKRLLRRSFRNWFQPHYPYVYAKFRCVYE